MGSEKEIGLWQLVYEGLLFAVGLRLLRLLALPFTALKTGADGEARVMPVNGRCLREALRLRRPFLEFYRAALDGADEGGEVRCRALGREVFRALHRVSMDLLELPFVRYRISARGEKLASYVSRSMWIAARAVGFFREVGSATAHRAPRQKRSALIRSIAQAQTADALRGRIQKVDPVTRGSGAKLNQVDAPRAEEPVAGAQNGGTQKRRSPGVNTPERVAGLPGEVGFIGAKPALPNADFRPAA